MDYIYRNVFHYEEPQGTRTKQMRVLGLGLARSGTESLCIALTQLGYKTYHGYTTFEESPDDHLLWKRWLEEKFATPNGIATPVDIPSKEFDRVLGGYEAVTDSPCATFGQELVRAYPEAKVILNRRKDVDAWYRSFRSTVYSIVQSRPLLFIASFDARFYFSTRSAKLYSYTCWGGKNFLQTGKQMYNDHYDRLQADLKPGTYLDWTPEDGWEPLCKFLGKPVPETPFPRGNDLKAFEGRSNKIIMSYLGACIRNLLMILVAMLAVGYGIWRHHKS